MATIRQYSSNIFDIETIITEGDVDIVQGDDCISVWEAYRIDVCRALLPDGYEIREKEVKGE